MFFYANAAGSRVFFDELGPEWTKHPCTDRRSSHSAAVSSMEPFARRPRGAMVDFCSAVIDSRSFPSDFLSADGWSLAQVADDWVFNEVRTVSYELLGSDDLAAKTFQYLSAVRVLLRGDIFSIRGNQVSCLSPSTLEPIVFSFGEMLTEDMLAPKATRRGERGVRTTTHIPGRLSALPSKRPKITSTPAQLRARKTPRLQPPQKRFDARDMTEKEVKHFHSTVGLPLLLAELTPLVRAYARNGIRKPHDVCRKLNGDKKRTACGSEWTPRLVIILLALMFNDFEKVAGGGSAAVPDSAGSVLTKPETGPETPSLTTETLVRKLSQIGRVTLS